MKCTFSNVFGDFLVNWSTRPAMIYQITVDLSYVQWANGADIDIGRHHFLSIYRPDKPVTGHIFQVIDWPGGPDTGHAVMFGVCCMKFMPPPAPNWLTGAACWGILDCCINRLLLSKAGAAGAAPKLFDVGAELKFAEGSKPVQSPKRWLWNNIYSAFASAECI